MRLVVNNDVISHCRGFRQPGFPPDTTAKGGRITCFGTAKTHLKDGDQVMTLLKQQKWVRIDLPINEIFLTGLD